MNPSFLQIAITVRNLDRAVAWWEEMFGAETIGRAHFDLVDADVAIVQGPGVRLELLQPANALEFPELVVNAPDDPRVIGSKAIVLQADDVPALIAELDRKGATIVWRDLEAGDAGPISAIQDSEGNLITIFPRHG